MSLETRLKRINVRYRILFFSLLVGLIFFIATTPLLLWVNDLISKPSPPTNVTATFEESKVLVSWEKPNNFDIKGFILRFGDNEIKVGSGIREYSFANAVFPLEFSIISQDIFGNKSNPVEASLVNEFNISGLVTRLDSFSDTSKESNTSFIILISLFIVLIVLIGTQVVLLFPVRNVKRYILGVYPTIVTFPVVFLSLTFLVAETNSFSQLLFSFFFSILVVGFSYFLLLITNILHTSLQVNIPLEQAARAAQFIFSLLTSYVVLILFFGTQYNFFEKIVLILPFIFALSFASIHMLPDSSLDISIIKSASISITILFAIFVLSIWPINYIYAILGIAVCFYIMLSISLETRPILQKYVWVEYTVLAGLIVFLLLTNSFWGINGTLI
ncbi:MAG: hypothetical protein Kow0081_2160 [Candidatus Dojkabacteria bacterium]